MPIDVALDLRSLLSLQIPHGYCQRRPSTRRNGILSHEFNFKQSSFWRDIMLSWALTFLIIALIAGALGFGGVAGEAAWVAHVLFVIFIVLFLVSLIAGRRVPPV
jgi:uncharacterized membrane protein YtjA (UPF0391 family)